MKPEEQKERIVKTLSEKASIKQKVYDKTLDAFDMLKKALHEISVDYNSSLKGADRRVFIEYRDRGKFEAELKIAGDMLIFSMHSNIFEFDRDHIVRSLPYIKEDDSKSYCGIINVYNFLADSFKYNRTDDLGYLISRIFINRDVSFFVEGKRQQRFSYKIFGKEFVTKEALKQIVNNSVLYSLEFDLLVPPYDNVKITSVAQMNKKFESSKMQTGKRLGFLFKSDDVLEEPAGN